MVVWIQMHLIIILCKYDDGSCEDVIEGCTDESAFNFSPTANTNDGTCIAVVMVV